MIGAFTWDEGAYRARMSADYNVMLRQLIHEILIVLDEPGSHAMGTMVAASTSLETDRDAPVERALGYLLPTMSSDPRTASELRAMTEDHLRGEKSSRLRKMMESLRQAAEHGDEEICLEGKDVWEWLAALNDVRLGLAGELGLDTDADADRIVDLAMAEPTGQRDQSAAAVYMLLTWWQDSLLLAMKSRPLEN
ncbi:DUF2017 family protein [Schaalia vaccimaxillae]|uniref:DUF2017 family protein n=1 Tax=Schaalia vaccimaxillae TaxID=183916 RepID=UPI0003B3D5E6|nr:DUF2017 family protein [Schaalia vaccimaxillae]